MNLSDADLRRKQEELRQYKKPDTEEKHVGVELEFSCPTPLEVLELRVIEAKLEKHISMGRDGGSYPGEYGYEWRILVKQSEMESVIKRVAKIISESGGKYHEESGFHVHLDMRLRDPAKAFNNLVRCQPILYGLASNTRNEGGKGHYWCKPQVNPTLGDANKGKHAGINPLLQGNKNSIEVRIRESCVDGSDIYNWVRLLCSIVDTSRITVPVNTAQEFFANVKMAKYTRAYVMDKLKLYNRTKLLEVK